MILPDYISPIVGCRTWLWDNVGLRSLCGERWHPGRVLVARCRAAAVVGTIAGRAEGDDVHDAPQPNCTCGVYASKSFEHLHTTKYARCGLYGEVNLWGTVVEHEQGWRTQFAYPKSLYLPSDTLPHSSAPIQDRLRGLIAYGVNIFVGDDTRNIPLWTKDSGLNSAGLDHLIEIGKEHCDRPQSHQILKKGDRVAVLGRGIAVVEHVDSTWIQAVVWNKCELRIARKCIRWDERNMRWETSPSAYVKTSRKG